MNNTSWFGLFKDQKYGDKKHIKKIDMIPTDVNKCRISSDGMNVYANANFYPGDIIEICPTKAIDKAALYSKDMRDIVFEVIPNDYYVVPFGYCQFYAIVNKENPEANCDFLWDDAKRTIIIKALSRIPANSKLILNVKK